MVGLTWRSSNGRDLHGLEPNDATCCCRHRLRHSGGAPRGRNRDSGASRDIGELCAAGFEPGGEQQLLWTSSYHRWLYSGTLTDSVRGRRIRLDPPPVGAIRRYATASRTAIRARCTQRPAAPEVCATRWVEVRICGLPAGGTLRGNRARSIVAAVPAAVLEAQRRRALRPVAIPWRAVHPADSRGAASQR